MVAGVTCSADGRLTRGRDPALHLLRHLHRHNSFHHIPQLHALLLKRRPPTPSPFAWNVAIRAYTLARSPADGIDLYCCMAWRGVAPDAFTFPFVLNACSAAAALRRGKQVHARALKSGLASSDVYVQNTLLDMYLKCGASDDARTLFDRMGAGKNVVSWSTAVAGLVACGQLEAARRLFDAMPARNVVSWTAMIHGHVRRGSPEEAFALFRLMQVEGVRPNVYTVVTLLVACSELGSAELGSLLHEYARKSGFEVGSYLGTALVDMYSKCGRIDEAVKVFDEMSDRSVATWNTIITGLGVHGRGRDALRVFSEMEASGVEPDKITFVGVLSACVQAGLVEEGCGLFERMREVYGIEPIPEHRHCMMQLMTGRATSLELEKRFTCEAFPPMPSGMNSELQWDDDGCRRVIEKGMPRMVHCKVGGQETRLLKHEAG